MLQAALHNLIQDISLVQLYVQNSQDAGFSDMTRLLESLSIKIFNAAFGYELKNKNLFSPNFPAIDLADDLRRVAVQVTTTADSAKVRHTIDQFEKFNLGKSYDNLYIYGFLKCSKVAGLPTYCTLVKSGDIISSLADQNDEDKVQEVTDAVKQHSDFSRVHPYDDRKCFEVALGVIDRNAIKHKMCCEGSLSDMVKGLNEITEVISKGMLGRRYKGKSIDEFYDEAIKECLREVRNDIGLILALVNAGRINGANFYNIDWDEMRKIDELKMSIMNRCNKVAKDVGLVFQLRPL